MITLADKLRESKFMGVRRIDRLQDTISRLALCVKRVSGLVRQMPFKDISQFKGSTNVQGEQTQWLDEAANAVFHEELAESYCGIAVSEEDESAVITKTAKDNAEYLLSYDPLDGSSNLGVNIPVGTIFGLWQRADLGVEVSEVEYFQPGRNLIAAGYSVYGPTTLLVLSWGDGVHEFALDDNTGKFILLNSNLEIPSAGKTYSCNEGNSHTWDSQTKRFVDACKAKDEKNRTPWGARYVGSLVADFHRNLKKGGVFLYPADSKNARGKLRMLYECLPMAMICRAAGGRASDGKTDLLDLSPTQIHERCPLIIGSKNMVDLYDSMRG